MKYLAPKSNHIDLGETDSNGSDQPVGYSWLCTMHIGDKTISKAGLLILTYLYGHRIISLIFMNQKLRKTSERTNAHIVLK